MNNLVVYNHVGRGSSNIIFKGSFDGCNLFLSERSESKSTQSLADHIWISEKQKPVNGREILIHYKDKLGEESIKLGFHADFQCIDADGGSECYDQIGGNRYLEKGWYEKVFNNSKYDCKKMIDLDVLYWCKLQETIGLENVTYDDYMELSIVSGALSYKKTENWLNHYWVLHSDRDNIEL